MTADENQNAIRFGRELNRIRRNAGFTQTRLARALGISASHLSNIERGARIPNPHLVTRTDAELSQDGRLTRVWEDLTGTGRPAWLDELASVERDAMSIMEFQLALFPSLVQTEDYARAIIHLTSPWSTPDEIEATVNARMRRAKSVTSAATPVLWMIIDRSVLTRRITPDRIMRAQLAHVVELIRTGRISVQVVEGRHAGVAGSFKIIASRCAPDVVYAESPHSGQLVDEPEEVQRFRLLITTLHAAARPPEESLRLIVDEMEGLGDE